MILDIELDRTKCELKGRNGYSRMARVSGFTPNPNEYRIDFCTFKSGNIGPAAIVVDRASLQAIVDMFQTMMKGES